MKNHSTVQNLLAAYALGELNEQDIQRVKSHLVVCEKCRNEATQMQAVLGIADSMKSQTASEQMYASVTNNITAGFTPANTEASKKISWSRIMKSKTAQGAIAAILILGALTGIYQLTGSIDGASIAFADVIEAMKNVPWLHQESRGFQGGVSGTAEQWLGFESKVHAAKWADGKRTFWDIEQNKRYEYDPEVNHITITDTSGTELPFSIASPTLMFETMHKTLVEQGAVVTVESTKYNGRKVQLHQFSLSLTEQKKRLKLYIDPQSKYLIAAEISAEDASGNVLMDGAVTFSYPQTGPTDIYALGISHDTPIVSNLPNEDYLTVWEQYKHNRKKALNNYIAIIAHEDQGLNGIVTMVDIDYKSGRKHRLERHSVFNPDYKKQLGDSFESLLMWTQNHYDAKGSISIYLYDGAYNTSIRRTKSQWSELRKHYVPNGDLFPNFALGDIAWPDTYGKTGKIIEDDFSKEHNYICVERLQQGRIHNDTVSPPRRVLYYLNPEKNYMCIRYVLERNPDAEWQEDKHWLEGVDPEKIRDGSITVRDITETIQAENGIWYPRLIVEKQTGIRKDYKNSPLKNATIKEIFIKINPEFPEGIFDINSLPK